MQTPSSGHEPVLIAEVLEFLGPSFGAESVLVDCTLGRGGHGVEIATRLPAEAVFVGLDADPRNLQFAADRLKGSGAACKIRLFHANFAHLATVLKEAGIKHVNGILADLGISTNQLFDPAYGLSFEQAAPLDMRLDPEDSQTAADLVNRLPENDLANVLYELAQERYSRRIARKIGEARRRSPIKNTDELAALVRSAIGRPKGPPAKIDPATRTFLALRMAVNREKENLAALLEQGPGFLVGGGRMAVIGFQSTEDRAIKQAFRSLEQTGVVKILTKKPLSPTADEIAANPRSRSAKMRVIEKV